MIIIIVLIIFILATSRGSVRLFPSIKISLAASGDSLRLDLLLKTANNKVFLLEPAVGFETNLNGNTERKRTNYQPLASSYNSVDSQIFPGAFSASFAFFHVIY